MLGHREHVASHIDAMILAGVLLSSLLVIQALDRGLSNVLVSRPHVALTNSSPDDRLGASALEDNRAVGTFSSLRVQEDPMQTIVMPALRP